MWRLRPTLTVVSVACCVLLIGLWGWSYLWAYVAGYSEQVPTGASFASVYAVRGKIVIGWGNCNGFASGWSFDEYPRPDGYDLVGAGPMDDLCGLEASTSSAGVSHTLWFPVAFPAVIAAIAPARCVWRRRRRQGNRGFAVEVGPSAGSAAQRQWK